MGFLMFSQAPRPDGLVRELSWPEVAIMHKHLWQDRHSLFSLLIVIDMLYKTFKL